jgi:hypothetical protein
MRDAHFARYLEAMNDDRAPRPWFERPMARIVSVTFLVCVALVAADAVYSHMIHRLHAENQIEQQE